MIAKKLMIILEDLENIDSQDHLNLLFVRCICFKTKLVALSYLVTVFKSNVLEKSGWVKSWWAKRNSLGVYHKGLNEVCLDEDECFHQYSGWGIVLSTFQEKQ